MRTVQFRSLVTMLAVLAATPLLARAEIDADRIPADAVAYIHWSGKEALGDTLAGSHVQGLFDTLKVREFIDKELEKRVEKISDPQKREQAHTAHDIIRQALDAPTSLYVGSVDFSNPDKPMPCIAIYSKVGAAKAGEFSDKLNALLPADAKDQSPPVAISAAGDYLLVNIGADTDMTKRLSGIAPTDGLGANEAFNKTMAQFGPGAADAPVVVYVSGETGLQLVDEAMAAKGPMGRRWSVMESALGIGEIKQIAWVGNFDGADWSAQALIGMGEQRTGLLGFFDSHPLSDEAYKLIPANATWAGVSRFDGTRFLDDMRNAAAQADPRGQQQFDAGLRQFFAFTGVDLKNDLLASMGDEFVYFAMPDANGKSIPNMVLVTHLKNSEKADTALSSLENTINAMISQRDANSTIQFKTEPLDAPDDKTTVHILTLPDITPTWAIHGDMLYIALNKSAIQHAIDDAPKNGTILDNPTFAALRKKLGQDQITSFEFLDTQKIAPEDYEIVKELLGTAGEHLSYTLPPVEQISPNLTPYLKVAWTDAAGYHLKSIGPFPLSGEILSPQFLTMQHLKVAAAERRRHAQTEQKDATPATMP
jgi:hypothetical protein